MRIDREKTKDLWWTVRVVLLPAVVAAGAIVGATLIWWPLGALLGTLMLIAAVLGYVRVRA